MNTRDSDYDILEEDIGHDYTMHHRSSSKQILCGIVVLLGIIAFCQIVFIVVANRVVNDLEIVDLRTMFTKLIADAQGSLDRLDTLIDEINQLIETFQFQKNRLSPQTLMNATTF